MYVERKALDLTDPSPIPPLPLRLLYGPGVTVPLDHGGPGSFREHTAISRALGLNPSFILIKDAPSDMLGLNSKGKKEGKKGKVLSSFFIFCKEWRCPLEKSHTIVLNLAP